MSELKPCPFCGGDVDLSYIGNDHTKKRSVEIIHKIRKGCAIKHKQSALRNSHEWLADKAVGTWNTRHKEGEWISVADRLPEETEYVLSFTQHETFKAKGWSNYVARFEGGEFQMGCHKQPTHWMSLPKPPKEN